MTNQSRDRMVNSRVSNLTVISAARVLKANGLTISSFIRNALEYVALTQQVPECGFALQREKTQKKELASLFRQIKDASMPGRSDYANISAEQMADQMRMERYGY